MHAAGFRHNTTKGRDNEGIAFVPDPSAATDSVPSGTSLSPSGTLFISGEEDGRIVEYGMDATPTGRELSLPPELQQLPPNLGIEALTYNAATRQMWLCNESMPVWLAEVGDSLSAATSAAQKPPTVCPYALDAPSKRREKARNYAHGIGTLAAMDDGSVLVLEREFHVPRKRIGASVVCKLFQVWPALHRGDSPLAKRQLCQWRTRLTLTSRSLANYEGMCLGPRLRDGSRVLVLVADSQHRHGGVLRDWIKTVRLK